MFRTGYSFSSTKAATAFLACFCALPMAGVSVPVAAQALDYRDPGKAPPSWIQFAKLVKYRFEEWLGSDNPIAARFRVYLKAHAGAFDGPPATLTVRAWVNPDGSVDRVSFSPFADKGATADLTAILTGGNVGEAPPPEMLQPLNLRFSLNSK